MNFSSSKALNLFALVDIFSQLGVIACTALFQAFDTLSVACLIPLIACPIGTLAAFPAISSPFTTHHCTAPPTSALFPALPATPQRVAFSHSEARFSAAPSLAPAIPHCMAFGKNLLPTFVNAFGHIAPTAIPTLAASSPVFHPSVWLVSWAYPL